MIKKDVWILLKRSGVAGLAGTFLSALFLARSPYASSTQDKIVFFLFFLFVCTPFAAIAALLIGRIIWWIEDKRQHDLGGFTRTAVGAIIGTIMGCIVGALQYYSQIRSWNESIVYLAQYFGIFGVILGATTGAVIGIRRHRESNGP